MSNDFKITGLGEHAEAYSSIAGESLHFCDEEVWKTYIRRVGPENFRLVWSGDRLAGGVAFYRCGQWYGGESIPIAAVSGVAIEPSFRGAGACRELLVHTLRELAEEGVPMASLFASTQRLYRSVGFEQSGVRIEYSMPLESFALSREKLRSARALPVRREMNPSYDQMARIAMARGRTSNGNLERTPGLWERVTTPIGGGHSCTYFFGEQQEPEGYLTLLMRDRSSGHPAPLVASDWIANTPRALHRMMAVVADHSSMCDRFQWSGGPQDPLLMLATEQHFENTDQLMTLNRILDLKAALEARGYPRDLEAELHLDVDDSLIEKNSGRWVLQVREGRGQVKPGGGGGLRVGIDALVPLFTSYQSATQLAQLGKIDLAGESSDQLGTADLVFSGPAPWTAEMF